MRPSKLVASAVLTAALALVALPGLAGSRTPKPIPSVEAAAFQSVVVSASRSDSLIAVGPLDAAHRSAAALEVDSQLVEPGGGRLAPARRAAAVQPDAPLLSALKPPRYVLHGVATFYDAGYTAMRLPRGTVIRVCGAGGCLERVITDYGPIAGTNRIIDLYRPDFFRVCGCAWWSGTTRVTVSVY